MSVKLQIEMSDFNYLPVAKYLSVTANLSPGGIAPLIVVFS